MGHTRVMPSSAASAPYTWDDFVALDEDDLRELIDGELVEVEVPTKLHESGFKVRINERRGVMPDLQFFRSTNPASRGDAVGLASGHPDLAVEVLSESSRRYDRVTKLAWYASIAVPEYWIIDPASRTLDRLVLQGAKYLVAEVLADDATLRPDSFEGLEIPLGTLWQLPQDD